MNFLFCTTTIIEGVNTSAKNIIYFDSTKGKDKHIDFFDYSNIKGRAGRLMEHFIGNIYNFNEPPSNERIFIDFPFFQQKPISDEVLINLDDKNVKDKQSSQYKLLSKYPAAERELFKRNGVLISGQKNILEILKNDIDEKYNLVYWTYCPSKSQLEYVLGLAWNNLIKKGETTRPMTAKWLVKLTSDYSTHKDIQWLINNNFTYFKTLDQYCSLSDEDVRNESISFTFRFLRHWSKYKVPKWLNVINEIQKYVCSLNDKKPGNYSHYASQLENDFVRENLKILSEMSIPRSAIDKLEKKIPKDVSEDLVLDIIKTGQLIDKCDLIDYEKEIIRKSI